MPRRRSGDHPPDLPPDHFIRTIDELGRVVVPVEFRRRLGLTDGSPLEMFVDGDAIYLAPYREGCLFCGGDLDFGRFRGKPLCRSCAEELVRLDSEGAHSG
ncbi:MAG: AbrB/MazE/SpoVT family DNA-binding domain-containing protein [Firmicutes bacterium]|nr:AbrB/MazE/SpoVT family DNA-binding domain-containing protein [Bacillota bacterium]